MTDEEQMEMFNAYYMAGYPSRKASATTKPTYAELEKENAELKEKLKEHESVGNAQFWENVWSWKSKAEQLTKVKEIIKNLMVYVPVDLKEYEEAKQFISEVEK